VQQAARLICSHRKDFNNCFRTGGTAAFKFQYGLTQLLAVIAPIAKAIQCLESTHSTVADVYIFWLAVTASIHDVITDDKTDLPVIIREKIRKFVNFHFDQMINEAPSDIYLTGFILDPRMYPKPSTHTQLSQRVKASKGLTFFVT
jgi:hypothetical protein